MSLNQHSLFLSLCLQFLAMVFQDLLTNKDDYLRASRALLREIIKQTKHEINFQSFCFGLMQERKEASYVDMEFKVSFHENPSVIAASTFMFSHSTLRCFSSSLPQERFVIQVTDLLTVSMMLGITAQVKEAGIAWDKGEKKSECSTFVQILSLFISVISFSLNKCLFFLSDLEVLRSFQNQIAAIQRDAVWWLHTVVPTISKVGAKDYVHWFVTAHI